VTQILDIGAGQGRDLSLAQQIFPKAALFAAENSLPYIEVLKPKVDTIFSVNIEKDNFPLKNTSIDIIIANQVLEHTKEIFWIMHEISRCLRVGGYFIMGVPNVASLHNRLLLMLGIHPTQHKLYSAHVRPFSKRDTLKFMQYCFPKGYTLEKFAGGQFYPFPPKLARLCCQLIPSMAFSIFFLFKKVKPYISEFIDYPGKCSLETPFYTGNRLEI